jgi:hypothetical protein
MSIRSGEAWKQARFDAITGTDVAKILGLDDTVSRIKLFESKIDRVDPLDSASSRTREYLDLGRSTEGLSLADFLTTVPEDTTGWIPGMTPHPVHTFFAGTPDYIAEIPQIDGTRLKVIVELKSHFYPVPSQAFPIKETAAIPLKHWAQCQSYMEIYDLEDAILHSFSLVNGSTSFHIKRDKDVWDSVIFNKIKVFWIDVNRAREVKGTPDYVALLESMRFSRGEKAAMCHYIHSRLMATTTQF